MRIEIDKYGVICTYNSANKLHSFNNKPAYIRPNGAVYWYANGKITKIMWPDGLVEVFAKGPAIYYAL